MKNNIINCPDCSKKINVNEYMTAQLENEIKEKFQDEYRAKMAELSSKEVELNELKITQNEIINKQVDKGIINAEKKLREKIKEESSIHLEKLNSELIEKSNELKSLKIIQIENEKLKREFDTVRINTELEFQQKFNSDLNIIKNEIRQEETDKASLKIKELEEKLRQQQELHMEALKKHNQGSVQGQGEAFELVVEEYLESTFHTDDILPVAKGVRGADCLQKINHNGRQCGSIYYECKRTKNFNNEWVKKFRDDIIKRKANVGILVTNVMPDDRNLIQSGNIWICKFSEFKIISHILRDSIIKSHLNSLAREKSNTKSLVLYDYLTGEEFFFQVQSIVEGFKSLQEDLIKEKNRAYKNWAIREKNHQKVMENLLTFAGSIKSISGVEFPLKIG